MICPASPGELMSVGCRKWKAQDINSIPPYAGFLIIYHQVFSLAPTKGDYYNIWFDGSGKKSYTIEVDYVNLTWKPTEIKQINVYGTFNGWSTAKDLMIYNEETGIWSAECYSVISVIVNSILLRSNVMRYLPSLAGFMLSPFWSLRLSPLSEV